MSKGYFLYHRSSSNGYLRPPLRRGCYTVPSFLYKLKTGGHHRRSTENDSKSLCCHFQCSRGKVHPKVFAPAEKSSLVGVAAAFNISSRLYLIIFYVSDLCNKSIDGFDLLVEVGCYINIGVFRGTMLLGISSWRKAV